MKEIICSVCGESLDEGKPHVTAVVPFYKSEEHVPHVLNFVRELNQKLRGGVNAVFVIDGSPDESEVILRKSIEFEPYPIRVISLSRNFGVGPALHAAFSDQGNRCVSVVFGSDLQEPNELFVDFSKSILSGECEVALGQRESREDPFMMKVTSAIYWYLYRKLISKDTPKGGYDVFGISKNARYASTSLTEQNTNITAQVQWIGFSRRYFSFVRTARISGKSTWTFRKRFGLFVDTFLGFSDKFLLPFYISSLTIVATGVLIFAITLFGQEFSERLSSILTGLTLLAMGLSVFGISIVGSVVVRGFENSKSRPRFIIQRTFENQPMTELIRRSKR